jgi:hypothetical protein
MTFPFFDPDALTEFVRLQAYGLTEEMILRELARSKDRAVTKHLVRIAAARNQIHGPVASGEGHACDRQNGTRHDPHHYQGAFDEAVEAAAAEAPITYGEEVVRLSLNAIIKITMDLVTNADRVPHGIDHYITAVIAQCERPQVLKPETRDHILWCIANIQNGVSAAYAIDTFEEGSGR